MEIRVRLQLHFAVKFQTETNELIRCSFATTNRVIEMHTFLVTLVRQFDFSLPDDGQEIKLMRTMSIMPAVVGEEHKGPQMPLKITIVGNE
jgi:hypothetical protein